MRDYKLKWYDKLTLLLASLLPIAGTLLNTIEF